MKRLLRISVMVSMSAMLLTSCMTHYKRWTQADVIGIQHNYRPKPNVYLREHYIKKCLAKFDNGGSYLVPVDILDKYGRNLLGRSDGQFIMTTKQMDKLLEQANGNNAFIEHELGIPAGAWANKKLARIDIPQPQKLNLRLPSGNEAGADSLWLPGGKLPTGYNEAVIDPIPKGSYVEHDLK